MAEEEALRFIDTFPEVEAMLCPNVTWQVSVQSLFDTSHYSQFVRQLFRLLRRRYIAGVFSARS